MGASLKTTNYELPIFAANDTVGFATPNTFNTAMDKIDTQMAANAASADQAVHTANNAEASASAAQTAVGNANTNITRLNNQMAEVQSALNFRIINPIAGTSLSFHKLVSSADNNLMTFNFSFNKTMTASYKMTFGGSTYNVMEISRYNEKLFNASMSMTGSGSTRNYTGTPVRLCFGLCISATETYTNETRSCDLMGFYSPAESQTVIACYVPNTLNNINVAGNFSGCYFNTGGIIDNGIE